MLPQFLCFVKIMNQYIAITQGRTSENRDSPLVEMAGIEPASWKNNSYILASLVRLFVSDVKNKNGQIS